MGNIPLFTIKTVSTVPERKFEPSTGDVAAIKLEIYAATTEWLTAMKAYEDCRTEHSVLHNFYCWRHMHMAIVQKERLHQIQLWSTWYHNSSWGHNWTFEYDGRPHYSYPDVKDAGVPPGSK